MATDPLASLPALTTRDWFIDVVDDAGLLFVADFKTIDLFIRPDWHWDEMAARLLREQRAARLMAWRTGSAWTYKLRVGFASPPRTPQASSPPFRLASTGLLAVGTYADFNIPAMSRNASLKVPLLKLPEGPYSVRVHRMAANLRDQHPALRPDFHATPEVPAHFHVQLTHLPGTTESSTNRLEDLPWLGGRPLGVSD